MSAPTAPRALAAKLLAASPLAIPTQTALQEIHQRRENLRAPPLLPDPDLTAPEPMPILHDPTAFAGAFWDRMKAKGASRRTKADKATNAPSSKNAGRPSKRPSPFSIIDGDRED